MSVEGEEHQAEADKGRGHGRRQLYDDEEDGDHRAGTNPFLRSNSSTALRETDCFLSTAEHPGE